MQPLQQQLASVVACQQTRTEIYYYVAGAFAIFLASFKLAQK